MMIKRLVIAVVLASLTAAVGCSKSASTGPNGGDLVPIKGATAYAELIANADTGEVMVNTWDKDLQTKQPIEDKPITVGSGENSIELMPHAMGTDPSGTSSRFYGEADWVRGGGVRQGWMHGGGIGDHREFGWQNCWQAGRMHGSMWEEMGMHRRTGPGHERGRHGGGMDR
jgi:hypothetical protein